MTSSELPLPDLITLVLGVPIYLGLMFFFGRTSRGRWAAAITAPAAFGLLIWFLSSTHEPLPGEPFMLSYFQFFAIGQILSGAMAFALGMMFKRKSSLT